MYILSAIAVLASIFVQITEIKSIQIKTCASNDVISQGVVYEETTIHFSKSFQNVKSHTINSCRRLCRLRCYCSAVVFKKPVIPGTNGCYFFNFINISSHLEEDAAATLTYYDIPHKEDCKAINEPDNCNNIGTINSGVYSLALRESLSSYRARCDMETTGGGWTILQKRFDGSVDFYRDWTAYKNGFGDLNGEFWLGLDIAHELMKYRKSTLRFDLWDGDEHAFAEYFNATIANETENYRLSFTGYNGNAGDSMSEHNNMMFSTKDKDNDLSEVQNCATAYTGAWWYNSCHKVNLNGKYGDTRLSTGINWYAWKGHRYSLNKTEIKIKRTGID